MIEGVFESAPQSMLQAYIIFGRCQRRRAALTLILAGLNDYDAVAITSIFISLFSVSLALCSFKDNGSNESGLPPALEPC
jgi:hypothetical protein